MAILVVQFCHLRNMLNIFWCDNYVFGVSLASWLHFWLLLKPKGWHRNLHLLEKDAVVSYGKWEDRWTRLHDSSLYATRYALVIVVTLIICWLNLTSFFLICDCEASLLLASVVHCMLLTAEFEVTCIQAMLGCAYVVILICCRISYFNMLCPLCFILRQHDLALIANCWCT